MTEPRPADDLRAELLHALDFAYCSGAGYETPEQMLNAYDAARAGERPAPDDRLRALHRDAYAGASCAAGCGTWPCATIRILDEQATTPPTAEVWMVWREYEPVYACYATEDAAKLGTIDCWREEESSCPEYSWPAAGARLELVAGDEHTGIYVGRATVYGASQPTDRAAVLREAADRLDRLGLRDLATQKLRRMADEAETGGAQ
ncbi:hypothetical protein ACFWDT_06095 [Streptomyces diastaticus]|uniref:hypothetical protein n=1 Tax=Streptomyces diastaticus TaxID=1956 RepID=UPI0036AE8BA9